MTSYAVRLTYQVSADQQDSASTVGGRLAAHLDAVVAKFHRDVEQGSTRGELGEVTGSYEPQDSVLSITVEVLVSTGNTNPANFARNAVDEAFQKAKLYKTALTSVSVRS
jgi:hypothetical protein